MNAQTSMAAAFAKVGYDDPRAQLAAIADEALAMHPRTLDAARAEVLRRVSGDAMLLWAMFERWHGPAADMLLQAAAARRRAKSEANDEANASVEPPPSSGVNRVANTASPTPQRVGSLLASGPSSTARDDARSAVARVLSQLDRLRINGRMIGDCTPEEAMGWRAKRVTETRFIWMLCSGLPPGRPIRDFIRPAEADELWARAEREAANE